MVHVGKITNEGFRRGAERYAAMARGEWKVAMTAVPASHRKEPGLLTREEGEALLKRSRGSSPLIALDPGGEAMDSRAFALMLSGLKNAGKKPAFLVGGAFGLTPEVLKTADRRLSLSSMTMPHELATLVLMEQIYRAYASCTKRPYAK